MKLLCGPSRRTPQGRLAGKNKDLEQRTFKEAKGIWEDLKGTLDKYNIILQLFEKKIVIFIPLAVLTWVMTACWVLRSGLIYFWRNVNIFSIFYFSKSTSINTQYSGLWDTLKMTLFTKYLIKWKRIGRISWKFRYWFNWKSSIEQDTKKMDVILIQCPFKYI